jgi:hypothetical protein
MRTDLTRRLDQIERALVPREPLVIEVHYVDRSIEPGRMGDFIRRRRKGGYRFTYHPDGRRTKEVIPEEREESL